MACPSRRSVLAALVAGVLSLGAFGLAATPAVAQSGDIVFFAAASLKTALDRIAADWQAKTGKKVVFSYAASSTLSKQMEAGAPAQLFASADLDWMDYAQSKGLIKTDTRRTLLGNRLVLIAPADKAKPVEIKPGFDLAGLVGDGRLSVGQIASVPAGKYAKTALEKLGAWAGVEPKLAQAESVRAALAFVARGETPYGIVYATDAKAEPKVAVVGVFPEDSHPPIVYPFALTPSAGPDAAAFLASLSEPAAVKVFEAEGFSILAK